MKKLIFLLGIILSTSIILKAQSEHKSEYVYAFLNMVDGSNNKGFTFALVTNANYQSSFLKNNEDIFIKDDRGEPMRFNSDPEALNYVCLKFGWELTDVFAYSRPMAGAISGSVENRTYILRKKVTEIEPELIEKIVNMGEHKEDITKLKVGDKVKLKADGTKITISAISANGEIKCIDYVNKKHITVTIQDIYK